MMLDPRRPALLRLIALAACGLLSVAACKSSPAPTPAEPGPAPAAVSTCDLPAEGEAATDPGKCVPEASDATEAPPVPASFDCAAPAPLVPCCKVLLPSCKACVDRNRAVDEAWRAACACREAPPDVAPGATTP
jgi:hypothetical protein